MFVGENIPSPTHLTEDSSPSFQTEQKGGSARVMSELYNEACGDWSNQSITTTMRDLVACVNRYHSLNPARFDDTDTPFVIAEYGCATGAASVIPLKAIITAVRKISP